MSKPNPALKLEHPARVSNQTNPIRISRQTKKKLTVELPNSRYVNVTKRKVNPNFEVLPAGTFGGYPEHVYDWLLPGQGEEESAASAEASVRSSFDSKWSGGSGKKPRRKLRKRSIGSQYSQ